MLHENDVVRLKHNIPAHSPTEWPSIPSTALDTGTIGSVVMVYTTDSVNYEYEVEFVDSNGYTLALLTLKENDIEPVDFSFSYCKEVRKNVHQPKSKCHHP